MNIQYVINDKIYEWDNQKSDSNLAKHKVSFEDAVQV